MHFVLKSVLETETLLFVIPLVDSQYHVKYVNQQCHKSCRSEMHVKVCFIGVTCCTGADALYGLEK